MPRKKNPYPTVKTSVEIDERVWQVLESDANRSRRVIGKQIESILLHYYGLGDVDIDPESVKRVRSALQSKAFRVRPEIALDVTEAK